MTIEMYRALVEQGPSGRPSDAVSVEMADLSIGTSGSDILRR
ncbi:MAG: hypothetical protein WA988_19250 [Candidatus Nanopelagicales bacterium]|jgi:hypothetical protein